MKQILARRIAGLIFICLLIISTACQSNEKDKEALMQAIEDYENAWASGDFMTVESFFAKDAKRLHTEPYVWDRQEIKHYFEERASQPVDSSKTFVKNQWKKDREYLDIRIEDNIAYDVFITDKFKALHIWERQKDGSWKIQYDVGMLNYPCDQ